jgi:hypothetical protein
VQANDGRLSNARTPTAHAASHTNGTDDIQDATASVKGLATAAQITKLDGIATGANNYTHPNHSGDVTSVGDGATTIAEGAVTAAKMAATLDLSAKTLTLPSDVTRLGSSIDLASAEVTGTLPVANGGTGQTTATDSFDALAPTTTKGDLIVHNGTDNVRVPVGTNGQVLEADSAETLGIKWATPSGGGGAGTKTIGVFTVRDNQPTASDFATLDTRNSIAVLDFDDAATESAVFVGVVPEAADLTLGIIVSLRWMATTATSGDVRWSVTWERCNTDLDSDSFDTATAATAAANGTSGIITVTDITCTTIDSLAALDLYRVRVQRLGGDGADTMAGDAELIAVELRTAN